MGLERNIVEFRFLEFTAGLFYNYYHHSCYFRDRFLCVAVLVVLEPNL